MRARQTVELRTHNFSRHSLRPDAGGEAIPGASFFPRPPVPIEELPTSVRQFISRYIRSVEQLEILLLLRERTDMEWTVQKTYEVILSAPASVQRWLEELVRQ